MSPFARLFLTILLSVGLIVGLTSCGAGGTNNNQGRSFRANGYCADVGCGDGETGRIVPLSTDASALSGSVQGGLLTELIPLDGQTVITFMEIQNFLSEQFIRVDRIDCAYTVPGADPGLFIPDDSFAVGGTLEGTGTGGESVGIFGFEILSPDFFAFLNASRNSLPLLPFRIVATCSSTGVTSGGDTLTTNPLNYTIQLGEPSECCTGQSNEQAGILGGFQSGPGSGGDIADTNVDEAGPLTDESTTTETTVGE